MKKRKKGKGEEPLDMKLGIVWYKPEQWKRLKEISEDREDTEETFDEWQVNAKKGIKLMQSQGIIPEKVLVDVEEFLAWCSGKGLFPNGESRSEYAAWLMKERSHIREKT
jgi:uncharacterized protein YecA (UPF0149 family)